MHEINALLDEVYAGHERVSRNEIHRRAVAAGAPVQVITALDALPEGEYAQEEVAEALGTAAPAGIGDGALAGTPATGPAAGATQPAGAAAEDPAAGATQPAGGPGTAADVPAGAGMPTGIPAAELSDDDLERELAQLHRTREDTFRHASQQALTHHNLRMAELEREYLDRFPDREVDQGRLRSGARARGSEGAAGTGTGPE